MRAVFSSQEFSFPMLFRFEHTWVFDLKNITVLSVAGLNRWGGPCTRPVVVPNVSLVGLEMRRSESSGHSTSLSRIRVAVA
jgi:hypothetical protein